MPGRSEFDSDEAGVFDDSVREPMEKPAGYMCEMRVWRRFEHSFIGLYPWQLIFLLAP